MDLDLDIDQEEENGSVTKKSKRSRAVNHSRKQEAWQKVIPNMLKHYTGNLAMPLGQICMLCSSYAKYRCLDYSSSVAETAIVKITTFICPSVGRMVVM